MHFKDYFMSNTNFVKTLVMLIAIAVGVAGILYARVNLGMSDQDLTAWMRSTAGTLALAAAVIWVAVIGLVLIRGRW